MATLAQPTIAVHIARLNSQGNLQQLINLMIILQIKANSVWLREDFKGGMAFFPNDANTSTY